MATNAQLQDVIKEAEISHGWMLKSIKHKEDGLDNGDYSKELKHAIVVQELLEDAGK